LIPGWFGKNGWSVSVEKLGRIRPYFTQDPGKSCKVPIEPLLMKHRKSGKTGTQPGAGLNAALAAGFSNNLQPGVTPSYRRKSRFRGTTAAGTSKPDGKRGSAKTSAAATRLEKYMGSHLRKHPEEEGVHYSDLFEQFLPIADKPKASRAGSPRVIAHPGVG
jgi:hypothetical protein